MLQDSTGLLPAALLLGVVMGLLAHYFADVPSRVSRSVDRFAALVSLAAFSAERKKDNRTRSREVQHVVTTTFCQTECVFCCAWFWSPHPVNRFRVGRSGSFRPLCFFSTYLAHIIFMRFSGPVFRMNRLRR